MKTILLLILLAAAPVQAQVVPFWFRFVTDDFSNVSDVESFVYHQITVCAATGDPSLLSDDDGKGVAIFEGSGHSRVIVYGQKFYNDGAITANPNTTGDQTVFIEDADTIFSGGFDACQEYSK